MKRALAVVLVPLLFGVAGLAQFSGSWDVTLNILPVAGLDEASLVLNYEAAGWTFTGEATFDPGFSEFELGASGSFGPASVEASLVFSPDTDVLKWFTNEYVTPASYVATYQTQAAVIDYEFGYKVLGPAYRSSSLSLSMDFAGVALGLDVTHETHYMATFTYEEWLEGLTCPLPKWDVTAEFVEWDAPVTVLFIDEGDPQTTADDMVIYVNRFTLELSSSGSLSAQSAAFLDAIADDLERFATGDVTWVASWDTDEIMVRYFLPSYMTYTFTAEVEPFSVEVVLDDVCTGIQFKELTFTVSDLELCCDIGFDMELVFNKCKGFDHFTVSFSDLLTLCCGIAFDMTVEFGVDYKKVTLEPTIEWAGECLDVGIEVGWDQPTLDSLTIQYIGITCEYEECMTGLFGTAFPYIQTIFEAGTTYYVWVDADGNVHITDYEVTGYLFAFTPKENIVGYGIEAPSDWGLESGMVIELEYDEEGNIIGWHRIDWFEYEVAKLSFCGAACCGDNYTIDVAAYWAKYYKVYETDVGVIAVPFSPTLFGLNRIAVSATVPLMANLSITFDYEYNLYLNSTTLDFGWSFSFGL